MPEAVFKFASDARVPATPLVHAQGALTVGQALARNGLH